MHTYRSGFAPPAATRGKAGLWMAPQRAAAPRMNVFTLTSASTPGGISTLTGLGASLDRRPRVLIIGATPSAFLAWPAIHKEGGCHVVAVLGIPSASNGASPVAGGASGEDAEKALLESTTAFIAACIKAFDLPLDTEATTTAPSERAIENVGFPNTIASPNAFVSPMTGRFTAAPAGSEGTPAVPKDKLRGIKALTNIHHLFKAPTETPVNLTLALSSRPGAGLTGILKDVDIVYFAVDSCAALPPLPNITPAAKAVEAPESSPSRDSRLPLILQCIERGKHVILDHPLPSSKDYVKAANADLGEDSASPHGASPRVLLLDNITTQFCADQHVKKFSGLPARDLPSASSARPCETSPLKISGNAAVRDDIGEVRRVRLHLCLPLNSEHAAKTGGAVPPQDPFQGAAEAPETGVAMQRKIITRILDYGGPLGVLGLIPPSPYEVAMRALLTRAMALLLHLARWRAPSVVMAAATPGSHPYRVVEGSLFFAPDGGRVVMRFYLSVEPEVSFLQVGEVSGTQGRVELRDLLVPTVLSGGKRSDQGSPSQEAAAASPSPAGMSAPAEGGGGRGGGVLWRTVRDLLQEAPQHSTATMQRPSFSMRSTGSFGATSPRFRRGGVYPAHNSAMAPKVGLVGESMRLVIGKEHANVVLEHMKRAWLVQKVVEAVEYSISITNASGTPT